MKRECVEGDAAFSFEAMTVVGRPLVFGRSTWWRRWPLQVRPTARHSALGVSLVRDIEIEKSRRVVKIKAR